VDTDSLSISPAELAARMARGDAPLVLDVRRDVRFAESDKILPHAQRCDPDEVAQYARTQPKGEVVVYCVHGLEIGQNAAEQLRAAGWNARFLQGGIEGWAEAGLPTARKDPA